MCVCLNLFIFNWKTIAVQNWQKPLVSTEDQHESVIGLPMSAPTWTCLPPPSQDHPSRLFLELTALWPDVRSAGYDSAWELSEQEHITGTQAVTPTSPPQTGSKRSLPFLSLEGAAAGPQPQDGGSGHPGTAPPLGGPETAAPSCLALSWAAGRLSYLGASGLMEPPVRCATGRHWGKGDTENRVGALGSPDSVPISQSSTRCPARPGKILIT